MGGFKQELELFLIAVSFFTRIPVPLRLEMSPERLNRASRYFGLVGTLVGLVSAAVFYLVQWLLPASVAVILAMLTSVLLTGGFHEDGLADTADGFGGGWSAEEKLNIMKDSRIGSYGAMALVLALLLKFQLLAELALYSPASAASALVLGHTLSRVMAASIIISQPYVRLGEDSKSKPLAENMHWDELLVLLLCGFVLSLLLTGVGATLVLGLGLWLGRMLAVYLFKRQIGGYTGDTLGAAQQGLELWVYIMLLWLWSQT
ncbi:adenosylcobinamide-GDP ribazoletransferase [Shewanella sedimentimangrovi]|uniref:Adenosylcobinamide-GDP ribazoletransferase n=1 Tax=Shewanella sedimentimangrovi TaxID=2814293 RepID=A0ABX7R050_9GAMM|nr:adenosylcobinamide-GDP ribazoletransferase [Shewanella sedimentimangrovi]QSX36463.1 adenosylcobinamide-GDP ribazoletransferase [Shewanella sedimentimangrovi]